MFERVVEQACRLVGAASASLRLAGEDGELVPVATQVDIAGGALAESEPSDDLLRVVGRTQEPALLNSGTVSVLCIPLLRDHHLIGLITLAPVPPTGSTTPDAALLGRFATPAANAIANAQRYEAVVFLLDRGQVGSARVRIDEAPAAARPSVLTLRLDVPRRAERAVGSGSDGPGVVGVGPVDDACRP